MLFRSDERYGLFSRENPCAAQSLSERIARYAQAGRAMDPTDPQTVVTAFEELL